MYKKRKALMPIITAMLCQSNAGRRTFEEIAGFLDNDELWEIQNTCSAVLAKRRIKSRAKTKEKAVDNVEKSIDTVIAICRKDKAV